MVPRRGLEPPRLAALLPESSASTNSAIWADSKAGVIQGAGPVFKRRHNIRRHRRFAAKAPSFQDLIASLMMMHMAAFARKRLQVRPAVDGLGPPDELTGRSKDVPASPAATDTGILITASTARAPSSKSRVAHQAPTSPPPTCQPRSPVQNPGLP